MRKTLCTGSSEYRDTKGVMTLSAIVGTFIICWLPRSILFFMIPFTEYSGVLASTILMIFSHFNSTINPIIYACKIPDFWRVAKRLFKCQKCQLKDTTAELTTSMKNVEPQVSFVLV